MPHRRANFLKCLFRLLTTAGRLRGPNPFVVEDEEDRAHQKVMQKQGFVEAKVAEIASLWEDNRDGWALIVTLDRGWGCQFLYSTWLSPCICLLWCKRTAQFRQAELRLEAVARGRLDLDRDLLQETSLSG